MVKPKIINYLNSLMDADLYDVFCFTRDATVDGCHITMLECSMFEHRNIELKETVVLWTGDPLTPPEVLRDLLIEEFNRDMQGEGPGRS